MSSQLPASLLVLERGWLSANNILCFDGDTAGLLIDGEHPVVALFVGQLRLYPTRGLIERNAQEAAARHQQGVALTGGDLDAHDGLASDG